MLGRDTGTMITSPPQSSASKPVVGEIFLHAVDVRAGHVHLVDGYHDGYFGLLARGAMASLVCGMTPSSAATTKTTTSVMFAPRERIALNASWPGVSRKVMSPCVRLHRVGADVLSDAAGFAGSRRSPERIASSNDVLPWSTWPITVTTGGRLMVSSGFVDDGRQEVFDLEADFLHRPPVAERR